MLTPCAYTAGLCPQKVSYTATQVTVTRRPQRLCKASGVSYKLETRSHRNRYPAFSHHTSRACRRATARSHPTDAAVQDAHAAAQAIPSFRDIQELAKARNLVLSLRTVGPIYKIECRDGRADGALVATTNGFTVPMLKLMHCDTMRIFSSRIARSERQRVFGGGLFGLGLLIVAAVMSHGYACGCTKAEALAINDNEYQHKRLVKYYTRLGLQRIREVGDNGLADLPDLLVWGGAGTRMNCNPEKMLQKWFPVLQRMCKGD